MEWYPTPSYLVKRRVILEFLKRIPSRHVLEVGCGCGDLLRVLARHGYTGRGIDLSAEAVAYASGVLAGSGFSVSLGTPDLIGERFGTVIASEVMEHQEDDGAFLLQLAGLLEEGGWLLLTVPAHMKEWGANDDFCGHVRRYERGELQEKLAVAGFDDVVVYSYGVPVYNIMKPCYDRAIATSSPSASLEEKTAGSGAMWLMRGAAGLFRLLFNDVTMWPWYLLQRVFYSSDLGMGYFAAARKKERM